MIAVFMIVSFVCELQFWGEAFQLYYCFIQFIHIHYELFELKMFQFLCDIKPPFSFKIELHIISVDINYQSQNRLV